MALAGVLLALGLALFLFGFEHELPRCALERLSDFVSTPGYRVSAASVAIRLPHRCTVTGLKVLDRRKKEARPFLSAERIVASFAFDRLPWNLRTALKRVDVWKLRFPRLNDGYYIPDSVEFPGQPDFRETDSPVEGEFPKFGPVCVRLFEPDVLAVTPRSVTVPALRASSRRLVAKDIRLEWADTDADMSLDGELAVDLNRQLVRGSVHGQARQNDIRPMLAALEITNSYSFIDGFTGVTTPVDATCKFDVNLRNSDLHIFLDLHPTGGAYRGVGLEDVHGAVDIRVFVRDTFQNALITVGPLAANLADRSRLSGSVVYENTNDVGYVNFDCRTTTALTNALAIANVLTDGTLDCLKIGRPGEITLKGLLAVDPRHAATNDLSGTVTFAEGSLFGIPLADAAADYALRGTDTIFENARARTRRGGLLNGGGVIRAPGFVETNASYEVRLAADRVPLEDITDVFELDLGDRTGSVSGTLNLRGPMGSNAVARLTGSGSVTCSDGHLAKFRFFSGLFDALGRLPYLGAAMRVTGDSASVTLSGARADYAIAGGVLTVGRFNVDGSLFAIEGQGKYDMVGDDLDFNVLLKFKRDTILGLITRPISWTIPNFFRFSLRGPLERPQWQPSGPDWKNAITNPLK